MTKDDARNGLNSAIKRLENDEGNFKKEAKKLNKLKIAYEKYRHIQKAGSLRRCYWNVRDLIEQENPPIEIELVKESISIYLKLVSSHITIGPRPQKS